MKCLLSDQDGKIDGGNDRGENESLRNGECEETQLLVIIIIKKFLPFLRPRSKRDEK